MNKYYVIIEEYSSRKVIGIYPFPEEQVYQHPLCICWIIQHLENKIFNFKEADYVSIELFQEEHTLEDFEKEALNKFKPQKQFKPLYSLDVVLGYDYSEDSEFKRYTLKLIECL